MFTKSIRWRLQLWLAFLLICLLSGFGVTSYQLHRTNRLSQIDDALERRLAALSGDVRGRPPPPGWSPGRGQFDPGRGQLQGWGAGRGGWDGRGGRDGRGGMFPMGPSPAPFERRDVQLTPKSLNLFDEAETNGFYFAIWSASGAMLKHSTNAPEDLPRPGRAEADMAIHVRMRGVLREACQFTEMGDCVLAGRTIAADLEAMQRFGWLLAVAGAAVLVVGLGGGWLLAHRALRPVEEISAAAGRISAGRLSERINVAETDSELGRLAGVLNSTFARLEAAFAHQKQFTADASHELRTPLTVIISEAQTILNRPRTAEEYRDTVAGCLETAQRMRRLIRSLLELARFDAGQEPIERTAFDLAEQTRACVDLVGPLADPRGIRIGCDLQAAPVLGDPDRVGQVVTNLLMNAVQYNKDNGQVQVTTRVHKGLATLAVTDTGCGIGAEDLPHVFERFYRGDKSRARANGHAGLGLAISKAIVEAHGGTIEVSSQTGIGTTFTVSLPA